MKIFRCSICKDEYCKDDHWRRLVCHKCYRRLENERMKAKRAGVSNYTRSDMRCNLCGCELHVNNKVIGMRRCQNCQDEIKAQQKASRERAAEHAASLKRERQAPEPMGIPIYNPAW